MRFKRIIAALCAAIYMTAGAAAAELPQDTASTETEIAAEQTLPQDLQ